MQEGFSGSWYNKWSIPNKIVQHYCNIYDIAHCLLLPWLTSDGMPTMNNEVRFTMVESEWMDIKEDKTASQGTKYSIHLIATYGN